MCSLTMTKANGRNVCNVFYMYYTILKIQEVFSIY